MIYEHESQGSFVETIHVISRCKNIVFRGCNQLTPSKINKYLRGCGLGLIDYFRVFDGCHEWERAPESPSGACPDRDGQLLQGPPNRQAA